MRRGIGSVVVWASTIAISPATAQSALIADSGRAIGSMRPIVTSFHIASAILRQTRTIDVALPPSYERTGTDRRYPVAVVLDGETRTDQTAQVAEELARNGQVPEMILIGIENLGTNAGRVFDLTPPGMSVSGSDRDQGGDRFLDFIERELLPAVDRQFRGGLPRTLIGHSSGGVLATYAAATRPAFRAVVAIDAPVQLDKSWLVTRLVARARDARTPPLRFAISQARFVWPDSAWNTLAAAAPPSWLIRRDSLRLEAHETVYMFGAYLGLREVFRDYSRVASQNRPAGQVLAYYDTVSASLGATVIPPRSLLANAVEDLVAEGRATAARRAFTLLTAGYGPQPDAESTLAAIADAERLPEPAETVEQLLKTPFPSPAQIAPFVGEWRGSIWMTRAQPRNNSTTLRIRVENGKVVAETRNLDAPAELAGWILVDYLDVTPNGLTWGRLNRMRPRGVMLWEGALRGDTLSGPGRWGGISFKNPPEVEPGFSFVRVRN